MDDVGSVRLTAPGDRSRANRRRDVTNTTDHDVSEISSSSSSRSSDNSSVVDISHPVSYNVCCWWRHCSDSHQKRVFYFLLREISRKIYGKVKDDFLAISRRSFVAMAPVQGNVYKQTWGTSFTFISTRIKVKYNYNIIHINTEFVQKCKKCPSPLTPRCK